MLPGQIPAQINALEHAEQSAHVVAELPIAQLSRVSAAVAKPDGNLKVDLHFGYADNTVPVIYGKWQVDVRLICQRCLQEMSYSLAGDLRIALTDSATEAVAADWECVALPAAALPLWTLLEDEILLALPMIAKHEETQCKASEVIAQMAKADDTHHPFAILKTLTNEDRTK